MARAVLVGEDGCVLLAQLLASFLLVDGAAGASLSHSSKSRVSQIGEGEAEATGQGRPVAAACRSRKRRRQAHHRSTLRRHITAATILGHAPCSRLVIHTRTGDVSMLPLCLVAHLAHVKGIWSCFYRAALCRSCFHTLVLLSLTLCPDIPVHTVDFLFPLTLRR